MVKITLRRTSLALRYAPAAHMGFGSRKLILHPYSSVWMEGKPLAARLSNPMSAPTRTPRTSWIEEGLRALAAGGPDAVRIDALAQALGVTRGGFYWHFDGRQALLEEILDAWERLSVDEVIERVESEGGDARSKLRRLSGLAASSDEPLSIDLAVRDWSRREQTVAKRLRRVDNRRMEYMRSLFGAFCANEDDVEARCMVFYSLWIGNHFIAADHGSRARADVVKLALSQLEA